MTVELTDSEWMRLNVTPLVRFSVVLAACMSPEEIRQMKLFYDAWLDERSAAARQEGT